MTPEPVRYLSNETAFWSVEERLSGMSNLIYSERFCVT